MSFLPPSVAALLPACLSVLSSILHGASAQVVESDWPARCSPQPVRARSACVAGKRQLVMARRAVRNQRRIATTALLLASFLEICGCNPVRTCDQLRRTQISAMPWETLVQQCARCLSAHEFAILGQAGAGAVTTNLATAILNDQTVQEVLLALHGPSFNSAGESSADGPAAIFAPPDDEGPAPNPEPIAWPIPESVLFLYNRTPGPGAGAHRIGTAFVLSVRDPRHRQVDRYLVTARHIVDPEWANCEARNPSSFTVRFNRWTGGVGYETIALAGQRSLRVLTPADDLTDLALVPLNRQTVPNLERFKLMDTSFDELPTALELNALHQDQQIVTAAVSPPKMYGLMDFPVSDPGVLATVDAIPPVSVRCSADAPARSLQLWLISAGISQGLGGAPVYAAIARGPHHQTVPILIGIQSVVWPGKGVAGITPVAALADLVHDTRHRGDFASPLPAPPSH